MNKKICVIGLGYVGLPLAIELDKAGFEVVGFDTDVAKINQYQWGADPINEVGDEAVEDSNIEFTYVKEDIKDCNFYIIAVPTPIERKTKKIMLESVEMACQTVGEALDEGDYVVFESTYAPMTTNTLCVPILEKASNMQAMVQFKYGYSPERVAPSEDKKFYDIVKLVAGCDEESLEVIAELYEKIIKAGVHKCDTIEIAETSKMVENIQRDVNIAFMNEISGFLGAVGIDSSAVVEAATTKWNFSPYVPGLVGGQCISTDPYYMMQFADGFKQNLPLTRLSREINERFPKSIGNLVYMGTYNETRPVRLGVLGVTYKENCTDITNTKVFDIVSQISELSKMISLEDNEVYEFVIVDPLANKDHVKRIYQYDLSEMEDLKDLDGIVVAVAHDEFKKLSKEKIRKMFKTGLHNKPVYDIKGIFDKKDFDEDKEICYWRA